MGHLFWKFFLTFWGCLILASGATFGILKAFEKPPEDVRLAQGPNAQFFLETAKIVLQYEGAKALKDFLQRMAFQTDKPISIYALNIEGKELLNREIPDDLRIALVKNITSPDPPQRGLLRTQTPDNQKWAVFILKPINQPEQNSSPPSGSTYKVQLHLGTTEILVLLSAALASFLFAGILAYTTSKPFTRLKNGFKKVSHGALDTRLTNGKTSRGEIGALLNGFDQMANELQKQIEQQKTLLHDVSHELRSPLTRLNLAVGLARQSPTKIENSLNRIEHEAERLDHLIGQLLALSRLESKEFQPDFKKEDYIELLENVLQDAQFEAEQVKRVLVRNIQVKSWFAPCNANVLHSAFENVIRNAIRHTPEGKTITVTANTINGYLHIGILDEGPGIDPKAMPHLFDPFFKTGEHAGHGLGLAIVNKAIMLHGGEVEAINQNPGLLINMRFQQPLFT